MNKHRVTPFLVAAMLVAALSFPASLQTVQAASSQQISVSLAGKPASDGYQLVKNGDKAYTLTLQNFNSTTPLQFDSSFDGAAVVVKLVGKNSITVAGGERAEYVRGIDAGNMGLFFEDGGQSGSLAVTVTSQNDAKPVDYLYAIHCRAFTLRSGSITATAGNGVWKSNGIFTGEKGSVTILGGSLTATSGDLDGSLRPNNSGYPTAGVCTYDLTMTGGVLTAKSGNSESGYSYAIDANGRIKINGGVVTAKGFPENKYNEASAGGFHGDLAEIGGNAVVRATGSTALYLYGMELSGNAQVSGVGTKVGLNIYKLNQSGNATLTVSGENKGIDAIYGDSLSVSGGTLSATATGSNGYPAGIYATSCDFLISGGTVTARATSLSDDASRSAGIWLEGTHDDMKGNLTVTGGSLHAEGGPGYENYGIYKQNGTLTVSSGSVTATAGEAAYLSTGIGGIAGGVVVSGKGALTATGGIIRPLESLESMGSHGIRLDNTNKTRESCIVTLKGGLLKAVSKDANGYGIYAYAVNKESGSLETGKIFETSKQSDKPAPSGGNQFKEVDGKVYYYDETGTPVTGLRYIGGKAYWFSATGVRADSQWLYAEGNWYYLNANGAGVVSCWRLKDGKWAFLKADGKMAKNEWVKWGKDWYYQDANGYMTANKWVKSGGKWYYLSGNGVMAASKWVKDGKYWYYLNASGVMLTNTTTPDGYRVNAEGRMI